MKPSGTIFFQDEYLTIFHVDWSTVNGVIDITTITQQPFVWGKTPQGYVSNGIYFKLGVITVQRQLLRPLENGYEIVSEGVTQYEDYVQMNYPCGTGPSDPFKYHLNHMITDEVIMAVTEGSRWADVDDPNDQSMVWTDLYPDGSSSTPETSGQELLEWVDVWNN